MSCSHGNLEYDSSSSDEEYCQYQLSSDSTCSTEWSGEDDAQRTPNRYHEIGQWHDAMRILLSERLHNMTMAFDCIVFESNDERNNYIRSMILLSNDVKYHEEILAKYLQF